MALDVEFDRRGVELFAVVKGHASAQLDCQRLAIRRPLVAGRELRHDIELFVDVEELVAERGKHDSADEGSRQRRVEHVGILGQSEAQGLGVAGHGRDRCDRSQQGDAGAGDP